MMEAVAGDKEAAAGAGGTGKGSGDGGGGGGGSDQKDAASSPGACRQPQCYGLV